MATIRHIKYKV